MKIMAIPCKCYKWFNCLLDLLKPVGDLFIRYWVANVFFMAGLTKIASWPSTIYLFTHEYHVPLIPPAWAAYLGTGAELVLPVLILLGLGGALAGCVFIYI